MVYEVMLRNGSGWSSFDTLDKPLSKVEYVKELARNEDLAGLKELFSADEFKIVRRV